MATLRWRLYHTAARLVRHAGAIILRLSSIAAEVFELIAGARDRMFELYLQVDTT